MTYPAQGYSANLDRLDVATAILQRTAIGAIGTADLLSALSGFLGETSTTAYRGDRGKTAYGHSQLSGNPHATNFLDLFGRVAVGQLPLDVARKSLENNFLANQLITGTLGVSGALTSGSLVTGNITASGLYTSTSVATGYSDILLNFPLLKARGDGRFDVGTSSGQNAMLGVQIPTGSSVNNYAYFGGTSLKAVLLSGSSDRVTFAVVGSTGEIAFGNSNVDGGQIVLNTATKATTFGGNITASGTVTSVIHSQSTDLSVADISSGQTRISKNTTTGAVRSYVNDAGTIKTLTYV